MLPKPSTVWALLTFILPFVTAHWSRHHHEVARRARGDVAVYKRDAFTQARYTYYDVGLGACGQWNVPSDWIVALNVEQFGDGYPGPQCYKMITIQYAGKTAVAQIMDECMGCPYAGLDFSQGLFEYFADLGEGVLYGDWWFNDGNDGDQPSSIWTPPATPTPSSAPVYTPPPATSVPSTATPPATTTSSSTPLINSGTGLASVATAGVISTPAENNPQNIFVINNIVVGIGTVLSLAEKSK